MEHKGWIAGSALAFAALIGFLVPAHGIHDVPKTPVEKVRPAPEPLTAPSPVRTLAATAYVERSPSCRNPGGTNQAGFCWYEGWAFTRKTVCVDSSIAGAPLAAIARDFTGPGGLRVVAGGTAGACQKAGYSASQRVSFLSMSKNAAARYGGRVCGLTGAANYGNLSSVDVTVNVTGAKTTPCGAGLEWQDVFEHEFGHALGLSHKQKYVSSIMRDGHKPDATDVAHLKQIYEKRRS